MNACFGGNAGCASKIRKRDGQIIQLEMGCTGIDSCEQAEMSNFKGKQFQCRPNKQEGESVCSSCCDSTNDKNCNLKFINNSKWNPNYFDYKHRA